LILFFFALRRYATKKDGREMLAEEDASQFSLSAIWDEQALDGLENAASYDEFIVSQPVLRSGSSSHSPQLLQQKQGLTSIAKENAATGSVLRINPMYDFDASFETAVSSNQFREKETSKLGIDRSPDVHDGLAADVFSALSFSPLKFNSKPKLNESGHTSGRLVSGEVGFGDVLVLKTGSSLSDMDESDSSTV
jgi:hypothetical protein